MRSKFLSALALTAALAAFPASLDAAPDQTLGMAIMSALVAADGTLLRGTGVTAAERIDEGNYRITFNRSVGGCDLVTSLNSGDGAAFAGQAAGATFNSTLAEVRTRDSSGTQTDRRFFVIVFCGK